MGTAGSTIGWYALVADDDADWRQLVAQTLRRAGLQVCEATDGEELVARYLALRAITRLPIVIVSDIDMPGESGIEAIRDLRAVSVTLPILMMTGSTEPGLKESAQRAGADVVLAKPLAPSVLSLAVTTLVERVRT